MRATCKNCWSAIPQALISQGYDWCGRKCRREWIEKHKVKGAKKKYANYDPAAKQFGVCFDYEGNRV